MSPKPSIIKCLHILLAFSIFLAPGINWGSPATKYKNQQVPAQWKDLDNNPVDLNHLLKKKDTLHIVFIRAMGCVSCIQKGIEAAIDIDPNIVAIVGYVAEDELKWLKKQNWSITILRDINYRLIQRLKLRKTPVVFEIDKTLTIVKKIGL